MNVSKCCHRAISVVSSGEGTAFWICTGCKQATDPAMMDCMGIVSCGTLEEKTDASI